MNSKALIFFVGLAMGVAICAAILIPQGRKQTASTAAAAVTTAIAPLTDEVVELKASLIAAKQQADKIGRANDTLNARLQDRMKREAQTAAASPAPTNAPPRKTGLAALFGGDGTNAMSEAMTTMIKSAAEQQVEGKLSGLKAKLNLSAEQETAIRAIVGKELTRGVDVAQKMLKGEMSPEEITELGKGQASQKDQIKALLTPEQSAAYDEYELEERVRMARLVANSELMQMQNALQLDQAQQDKVFLVLVEQAQKQSGVQQSDPAAALNFRQQAEQKMEAMRNVLTPEQFTRYQKSQEQQLKLIEAFLPKSNSATPPAGRN